MLPVLAWRQAQVFAKHMAHMRLVVEAAVQCNLRKGLIRALNHGAGRLQPGLHDPGMRRHAREPCELTQKAQGAGAHHGGQIGNAQRPLELGGNAVQHARIAGAGACVGPAGAALLAGHEAQRSLLAPGIYGLSNGTLDEPWPKTLRLKALMLDWIVRDATHPETLLDGLREDVLPDVGLRTAAASDVPQEPALSPIFIRNPVYGTRCSTVVAIDDRGVGVIVERRYGPDGAATGETMMDFTWPD